MGVRLLSTPLPTLALCEWLMLERILLIGNWAVFNAFVLLALLAFITLRMLTKSQLVREFATTTAILLGVLYFFAWVVLLSH